MRAVVPRGTRRPRSVRLIVILGALSAFGPLSIDMYLPALPAMSQQFHAGAWQVQLTLTACVVGLGAGQLVAGPLSDTLGRRRPLLVGLLLYAAFSVGCALAPAIPTLIGFRLLQALGGAAGLVIARAVVRDLYSGAALARFFSLLILVMGVAPIVAPIIGGQLVRVSSWRGVFVVLTAIGVVLLAAVAVGLPETLPAERRTPGRIAATMRTYRRLLADRRFLGYVLAGAFGFAAMFAYISGSSFVFQDVYGLSPQQFSLVFASNALGLVLVSQLNGWLVGRFEPKRLLAVGLGITTVGGFGVLAAVLADLGLAALLPALFTLVASIGMVLPNATALTLADHPDTAGSASALFGVFQFIAGGTAAPLVGLGGSGTAMPMAIMVAALPVAAVLSTATLSRMRVHHPAPG